MANLIPIMTLLDWHAEHVPNAGMQVAELDNWGRWVRAGHGGISQCESIEGNYRRNRIPGDTETGWGDYLTAAVPDAPLPEIDVLGALAVERTMRFLPKAHRIALKLKYVRRMDSDGICRRIAIPYDMWEVFLLHAQLMVRNRLAQHNERNILSIRIISDENVPKMWCSV